MRIAELDELSYIVQLWTHKPLTDFWQIGYGTAKRLQSRGLYTMGDIAAVSLNNEDLLYKMFGINAELLIDHAWGYAALEAQGIVSPVKSVSCNYQYPSTFNDEIVITVSLASFNGVVLVIRYDMQNGKTGEQVCYASSEHVFLDREGRFVRMKRVMPEFYSCLTQLCEASDADGGK